MSTGLFYLVVNGKTVSVHPTLQDAKRIAEALIPQGHELQIKSGGALWQFHHGTGEWRQR